MSKLKMMGHSCIYSSYQGNSILLHLPGYMSFPLASRCAHISKVSQDAEGQAIKVGEGQGHQGREAGLCEGDPCQKSGDVTQGCSHLTNEML